MQRKIQIPNAEMTAKIFGSYDKNISRLEEAFSVRIANTGDSGDGDTILVEGEETNVQKATDCVQYLKRICTLGDEITEQKVDYIIGMSDEGRLEELGTFDEDCFLVTLRGKPIKAKTLGQKLYVESIR